MRRWLALLLLLTVVGVLWGQDLSTLVPFHPSDINWGHPLAQRLVAWWVVVPHLAGGSRWYDLVGQQHGTLTNMGAGYGFQPTRRAGWWGEMRFDGVDDYVIGDTNTVFDFPDLTFTVSLRYRAVKLGVANYLIAKRAGGTGGWYIRVNSDGTLAATILSTGDLIPAARDTTSNNHLDGNWRQVTVIFVIDTVTSANNDVGIYVNGVLDQGTRFTSDTAATSCACGLAFGAQSDGSSTQTLEGSIDDIRIWRGALPLVTIANLSLDRPPDFGGLVQSPLAPAFPSAVAGPSNRGQFFPFFQ